MAVLMPAKVEDLNQAISVEKARMFKLQEYARKLRLLTPNSKLGSSMKEQAVADILEEVRVRESLVKFLEGKVRECGEFDDTDGAFNGRASEPPAATPALEFPQAVPGKKS